MKALYDQKGRTLRGFFPTGQSAQELYKLLQSKADFWKGKFHLLQIDEFVGKPVFYDSLRTNVIDPLGLGTQQDPINCQWDEPQMNQHIQRILKTPIDFCLLGLGPNGHVGFHEPGAGDHRFLGGKVHLFPESFSRVKGAPSPWALTFGVGSFLQAEKIILLVVGQEKQQIYQKFLDSEPTPQIPATLLKNHPDFTVLSTISI